MRSDQRNQIGCEVYRNWISPEITTSDPVCVKRATTASAEGKGWREIALYRLVAPRGQLRGVRSRLASGEKRGAAGLSPRPRRHLRGSSSRRGADKVASVARGIGKASRNAVVSLSLTMLVSHSLNYVMRATEINNLQFPTPALSGHEAGGSRTSCTAREREREREGGRARCVQQPRLLQGRPVTMARVMIACPRLIISPPS